MFFKEFHLTQIDFSAFTLKTKLQSLNYGRRLYEYHDGLYHYWIKTQLMDYHRQFEIGFQKELEFYDQLKPELNDILLDHVAVSLETLHTNRTEKCFGETSLVLPHAEPIFSSSPLFLSIDQIKHQILQVLNTLEILHEQGWIHGDLKQEHIVQFNQVIKLLDFEQSIYIHHHEKHILHATPRYMAPELFNGDTKSRASDVYALGIILLEWLSQTRLIAKNYQEWAILHCQKLEIVLPEQLSCFKPLLMMMLNKHKTQRVIDFSTLKLRLMLDIV